MDQSHFGSQITRGLVPSSGEFAPRRWDTVAGMEGSAMLDFDDDVDDFVAPENKATLLQASAHLFKSFVGAGILALPFAFREAGFLAGLLMLGAISALSLHCMATLIQAKQRLQALHPYIDFNFGNIAQLAIGPRAKSIVNTAVVATQFGFCTSYLIFSGATLHHVIWKSTGEKSGPGPEIVVPLCMLKTLKKLSVAALIADGALVFGLGTVLYYTGTQLRDVGIADKVDAVHWDTMGTFVGNLVYVFEGVGMIIPIEQSMQQPGAFVPLMVVVTICLVMLFATVGLAGYLAYGPMTCQMITHSLPHTEVVATMRVIYSLGLLLTYPIMMFPVLQITEKTVFGLQPSTMQSAVVRGSVIFLSCGLAVICRHFFGYLTSIIGAVGCTGLLFVFPCLVDLRVQQISGPLPFFSRMKNWVIISLGIAAGIFSFSTSMQSIFQMLSQQTESSKMDTC